MPWPKFCVEHPSALNLGDIRLETPYALEIAGKSVAEVQTARAAIPQGTQINIAFLGNDDHIQRIHAARAFRDCGFQPVPIISSRRLNPEKTLSPSATSWLQRPRRLGSFWSAVTRLCRPGPTRIQLP